MLYLEPLQIGEITEVFKIFKNGRICVTKRSKINKSNFINPIFLREINILKRLSEPPEHLITHPGRSHIIKLLDVYTHSNYLHYDMELIDGTINDLKNKIDLHMIKEQILIDISNALQYIHEIGFNHCDLSNNNIGYCKLSNISKLETKTFKFILIDFGNSMHYRRPLTLELGTIYTIPLEIILAFYILKYIESRSDNINKYINIVRKLIVHKKSDIWSLGALSYYLHSFKSFTSSQTIKEQYSTLKKLETENIDISKIKGHREILLKTSIILSIDHMTRPITYFSPMYRTKKTPINKNSYDVIYKNIYDNILSFMSKFNNMIFMINRLDDISSDNLIYHCYKIDKHMLLIITNKIYCNKVIKISIMKLIKIIRIIIIWLVSHLYMNNIWNIDHIVKYLSKIYNNHITNNMIIDISIIILQTIEWNFEKFI